MTEISGSSDSRETKLHHDRIIPGDERPESTIHRQGMPKPRPDFLTIDEKQTLDEFRGHLDALKGLDVEYAAIMDKTPAVRAALEGLFQHSHWTARHSAEVGFLSYVAGKEVGFTEKRLENLVIGSTLHDLGKGRIRREILDKPARLTKDEETQMQSHPLFSFISLYSPDMLRAALIALGHHSVQADPYPFDSRVENGAHVRHVADVVANLRNNVQTAYGENFNAEAFDRLTSIEQLEAIYPELVEEWEVVTAADVVHAFRSHRPYKGSFPDENVREMTRAYNPHIIEALLHAYRQIPTLHGENDPTQPQQSFQSPSNS